MKKDDTIKANSSGAEFDCRMVSVDSKGPYSVKTNRLVSINYKLQNTGRKPIPDGTKLALVGPTNKFRIFTGEHTNEEIAVQATFEL